jgi:hypothetical protein
MNFINVNDFKGEINLDLSSDVNVLAQFEALADNIIFDILIDLLNAALYDKLMADLSNGIPQTQIYKDLVDGKTYTKITGEKYKYEGIKRMLRYFVWESYLEFNHNQNVSTGQITSNNENSTVVNRGTLRKIRATIQNKAVRLYNQAAIFINENQSVYFTGNEYAFWRPIPKKYIGKITSSTYNNAYYFNRSSEGN